MRQKSSIVGRISILAPIRSGIRTSALEVSHKADAVREQLEKERLEAGDDSAKKSLGD
jgi:hypothetical protein